MNDLIKQPNENQAREAAELIYMAGSHIFNYLFDANQATSISLIEKFYKIKGLSYSKESILGYIEDNILKGLVIALPYTTYRKYEAKSFNYIINENGFMYGLKYMRRGLRMMKSPKIDVDEYYIGFLAVFPEYRGQGIGVQLLNAAEENAKSSGYNKLSLYVEDYNEKAKRIYEKFGFIEIEYKKLPKKCHEYGFTGIYKMMKEI